MELVQGVARVTIRAQQGPGQNTGEPSFTSLLIVVAVAFAAPLALGLFPSVRLPPVVLELVTGIVIGPSGLGWVDVDATIEVLSVLFTGEGGAGTTLFLIGVLVAMGAVVFLAVRGGEHSMRIRDDLLHWSRHRP